MRTRLAAGLTGVALLTLSACSAVEVPDTTPSPSGSPDGDDVSGCLTGEWRLDTDDLAEQLEPVLAERGGSDVRLEGRQDLTFGQQGELTMDADLEVSATVDGSPVTRSLVAMGTGTWQWVDSAETLTVTDWIWEEPGPNEPYDQLPLFDPSDKAAIAVDCSADDLVLTPEGSPVAPHFTR